MSDWLLTNHNLCLFKTLKNMNTNLDANGNAINTEVEDVLELDEALEGDEKDEQVKKILDQNKQLYARTKKAEGFELVDGKWVKKPKTEEKKQDSTTKDSKDNLTQADLYTLIKANVPEEDLDEVIEYATLKKISVAEALKSNVVKNILATNAETRKVADGTNTDGGKRGNAKLSDTALLANADKGILPESDDDMRRLITLQRASKK